MNGRALWDLQQLDVAIDQLDRRLAKLPEAQALGEARGALQSIDAAIATADDERTAAEQLIEDVEVETAAITTKRTRLEQQLKTVSETRQIDALNHQIETLNAQRNELDDRELEAMERQSAAEVRRAELDGQRPAVAAAVAEGEGLLAAATAAANEQRDDLVGRRDAARADRSADELSLYDAARARHGGIGIARLDGTRCDGCHLDLSRAEADAVRAAGDGLSECPQCSRVLVP